VRLEQRVWQETAQQAGREEGLLEQLRGRLALHAGRASLQRRL